MLNARLAALFVEFLPSAKIQYLLIRMFCYYLVLSDVASCRFTCGILQVTVVKFSLVTSIAISDLMFIFHLVIIRKRWAVGTVIQVWV